MAGSPASQDAGACRALVKHTSGRTAARQVVVQLDSSLEARRLYTSPDGLLRASSSRSDVVSSRWGSPGAGGTEWASIQRQKLIEHPDSCQVCFGCVFRHTDATCVYCCGGPAVHTLGVMHARVADDCKRFARPLCWCASAVLVQTSLSRLDVREIECVFCKHILCMRSGSAT